MRSFVFLLVANASFGGAAGAIPVSILNRLSVFATASAGNSNGIGLDQFGIGELGILGTIIGVLLFTSKHLYKRGEELHNKLQKNEKDYRDELKDLQEKYDEKDESRTAKLEQLITGMQGLMNEVVLYLKLAKQHDEHHPES